MTSTAILAFWGLAVLLIVVPGPDWAFTLGATLRGQPVLAAVAGLTVGYCALTAVVAAGVGALVGGSPAVLTGLTLLGGGYLVRQGVEVLRHPSAPAAGDRPAAASWGVVARGVGVSGLNPKALLLFLALLPQFTAPDGRWPVAAQLALLGCVFTVTCAVFYGLLGTFAHAVLTVRPAAARLVSRSSGVGMVLVGALLIAERLAG